MDNTLNKIRELNKLIEEVKLLEDFLLEFTEINNKESDKLQYGCKVQYKNSDNSLSEGRVWKIKSDNEVAVNRDGHVNYAYFRRDELVNLSVGKIGRAERLKWIKEKEIEILKNEIDKANEDFMELELDLEKPNQTLQIEILKIEDIKNTDAKLLTFKNCENSKIRKIISGSKLLKKIKPGKFLFTFSEGILIDIKQLN